MLDLILPPEVTVAEVFGDEFDYAGLLAPEAAAIAGAGPKRRREYTAVRACARQALSLAGLPPAPIVPGPSGAPVWPPGVVGSMTHCEGYRACAIGPISAVAAIGIDAEPHAALPDGVLAVVASEAERAVLDQLGHSAPEFRWDRILFSAKESVFKAWSPATGQWLGFRQAHLEIRTGGDFTARLTATAPGAYHGRWLVARGLILTAVSVPAAPAGQP